MASPVYIGLGSNLGDPEAAIAAALQLLEHSPGLRVDAVSPLYWTEPQGVKDQPWFANAVARLYSEPAPEELLRILLEVERRLGRDRGPEAVRFGPRAIDLDLLLYGEEVVNCPDLVVPHPRMRERAFVLVPLRDLAPDLVFPNREPMESAIAKIAFRVHNRRITQS